MGCRRRAPVGELVRFRSAPDGSLVVGPGPGRGAWLCSGSRQCAEAAVARHALGRALRVPVTPDALRALTQALEEPPGLGGAGPQVCEDGVSGLPSGAGPVERERP